MTLPWRELLDAADEALEASRDDADLDRLFAAFARLDAAHDAMASIGTALVLEALARADLGLQRRLGEVFGDAARAASELARAAAERVDWALGRLDAAEERIRSLERRIDELTPGVGRPGRRV